MVGGWWFGRGEWLLKLELELNFWGEADVDVENVTRG